MAPHRILVIESVPTFSSRVQEIIVKGAGPGAFFIKAAPNLRTAFSYSDVEPFDLILLETSSHDDPALSAFQRLHQYVPHIPIIVVLDTADQDYALKILQTGAYHYLFSNQMNEGDLAGFLKRAIHSHSHQRQTSESEAHFRLMVENSSDVITTLEPTGVINYAGPSAERILNYALPDFMGRNLLDFIHRDDRAPFLMHLEKAFTDDGHFPAHQFRLRSKIGDWIHVEGKGQVVLNSKGQKVCILNSHDVTHRVRLENKLMSLSLRDELTGLHNRRSFMMVFDQNLKQLRRAKKGGLYLMFIDLDKFKWINDNLGHKEGDHALKGASHLLRTTFRDADVVARLGGDEFVVLLTGRVGSADVDMLKNRLYENLAAWNNLEKRPYQLQMSVGILAHDPKEPGTTEDLLLKADTLMYEQKRLRKKAEAEAQTASA